MSQKLHSLLKERSRKEPFANLLGLEVIEVTDGLARVTMRVRPELENIFGSLHGAAVFSLIDTAGNNLRQRFI